nr:hypothetical protein [Fodinicola feengrottensis]
MSVRMVVLWCPDWPVIAAMAAEGIPTHQPAAVLVGHRVIACSASARADGVRRGLRRREAQARCPELAVLNADQDRDAREFEPVVRAVEELAPGVEVVRPGLVSVAARGPSGYYGGDEAAAQKNWSSRSPSRLGWKRRRECPTGCSRGHSRGSPRAGRAGRPGGGFPCPAGHW